jgi:pSer/pThr/pTyr-binding forkhead associated (FHA) protein
MPITVVLHGEERPTGPCDRSVRRITLDAPRIVFGRSESCEVRLADASVSHRHASLRQRGLDWILVDEGSTNGTRIGRDKLGVQAPRRIAPRELVRMGRIWVELEVGNEPITKGATAAAKEAAIDLVCERLARVGEEVRPILRVVEGPDAGARHVVGDEPVTLGRSREASMVLAEPEASRKHLSVRRAGDALAVRDLGSKAGTLLGERPLGQAEAMWRPGTQLVVGSTVLEYDFEAIEALAELERAPDERFASAELEVGPEPPYFALEQARIDDATDEADDRDDDDDEAAPASARARSATIDLEDDAPAARIDRRRAEWGVTDLAVVVLALGVFSLSAVGYLVLLR